MTDPNIVINIPVWMIFIFDKLDMVRSILVSVLVLSVLSSLLLSVIYYTGLYNDDYDDDMRKGSTYYLIKRLKIDVEILMDRLKDIYTFMKNNDDYKHSIKYIDNKLEEINQLSAVSINKSINNIDKFVLEAEQMRKLLLISYFTLISSVIALLFIPNTHLAYKLFVLSQTDKVDPALLQYYLNSIDNFVRQLNN